MRENIANLMPYLIAAALLLAIFAYVRSTRIFSALLAAQPSVLDKFRPTPCIRRLTMTLDRRHFLAMAAVGTTAFALPAAATRTTGAAMYGLIGKLKAVPGQRDALISILLDGVSGMPGCLSYIVAQDPADADAIWITEAWDSRASHEASLSLPSVQAAIAKGRPLIAGFEQRIETSPVGGHGIGTTA
ncbi:putative quinol monooxygenase [Stenotrophomonas daejeonensis]|nr:putative quinol monooxygenase [Stenotrophomonas daejeonensis]